MIPKSISASSLAVSQLCLARWAAEYFHKAPRIAGDPADLGTSVHGALESFVRNFKAGECEWSWKQLKAYYLISFMQTFGNADDTSDLFQDGLDMLKKWMLRSEYLKTTEVISCEVKESFFVPYILNGEKHEVPFNFIWDRCDKVSEAEYRVVDYKTVRIPVSAEALKRRIQPRAYALAAQIKWPDAEEIWVEYDLLRHDAVGIRFTREDNAATWRYLKRELQRIVDTDESQVAERLNPECRFCIRKLDCTTLNDVRSFSVYGISGSEAAAKKLEVASQLKALEQLNAELDEALLSEAQAEDKFSWDTELVHIEITASRRRQANNATIAKIIGKDLMEKYGTITLTNLDKMLKNGELAEDKVREVKQQISVKYGEPTAKVTPLDPFEED